MAEKLSLMSEGATDAPASSRSVNPWPSASSTPYRGVARRVSLMIHSSVGSTTICGLTISSGLACGAEIDVMRMIRWGHCAFQSTGAAGELGLVNQLFGLAA
jgi:hypothetical protein